jgi:hypothetical protein
MGSAILVAFVMGCSNRLVSDQPWFARDEQHAPQLRPGLWLQKDDPDCTFDERQPAEMWPDCATSFVVREQDILLLTWVETGSAMERTRTYDWTSLAYLLVSGDPIIQQITPCRALAPEEVHAGDGSALDPRSYCYSALRTERVDASGRVVSIWAWPVYCGPWPTQEEAERLGRAVTTAPFPGIHVVQENCVADSADDVRMAARASEEIAETSLGLVPAHWVRDGYN